MTPAATLEGMQQQPWVYQDIISYAAAAAMQPKA